MKYLTSLSRKGPNSAKKLKNWVYTIFLYGKTQDSFIHSLTHSLTWLTQSVKYSTLDFKVMSLNPTLGIEPT